MLIFLLGCDKREYSNLYDPENIIANNEWSPQDLQYTLVGDTALIISWVNNEKFLDGFVIQKAIHGDTNYNVIGYSQNNLYFDDQLTYGIQYLYRIAAYTNVDTSKYSSEILVDFSYDCQNILIGKAFIDDCGDCVGGTTDCSELQDAEGKYGTSPCIPNWSDLGCGCFESAPSGCDFTCGSTLAIDECGVCGGTGIQQGACDCEGNTYDCTYDSNNQDTWASACGGTAFLGESGYCVGGETGKPNNYWGDVVDADGNIYYKIKIGDQLWLQSNLFTTIDNNGNNIPNAIDNWENTINAQGALCEYNNDTFYTDTYGYLYNWNAIENICPGEMHIPSKNDWIELFAYLNSNSVSETSFSSKLAGYRNGYNGYYYNINETAHYWTSSLGSDPTVWVVNFNSQDSTSFGTVSKQFGFSVRCMEYY